MFKKFKRKAKNFVKKLVIREKEELSFCIEKAKKHLFTHAGNAGDIVFGCALLKALWKESGEKQSLFLHTNVLADYEEEHPLKNILMSEKVAQQLVPMLQMQPYISSVTIGSEKPKNTTSLDAFRFLPIQHRTTLIQGWCQLYTDVWVDLFEPWLYGNRLPEYKGKIVVSRTARMRSRHISYSFLREFSQDLLFVGLPCEFSLFKKETGIDCPFLTVSSFDLLLNVILSCRLFVGNQGLAYSIAEAVQSPRVLESNTKAPNNYPLSPNGRVALFHHPFETFVKEMVVQ